MYRGCNTYFAPRDNTCTDNKESLHGFISDLDSEQRRIVVESAKGNLCLCNKDRCNDDRQYRINDHAYHEMTNVSLDIMTRDHYIIMTSDMMMTTTDDVTDLEELVTNMIIYSEEDRIGLNDYTWKTTEGIDTLSTVRTSVKPGVNSDHYTVSSVVKVTGSHQRHLVLLAMIIKLCWHMF